MQRRPQRRHGELRRRRKIGWPGPCREEGNLVGRRRQKGPGMANAKNVFAAGTAGAEKKGGCPGNGRPAESGRTEPLRRQKGCGILRASIKGKRR